MSNTTQQIALTVDDLTVAYNSKPAIWDIDLNIPEGVLMAIVGPNGAGKSTLIKAVLNLIPRAAGTAQFYGKLGWMRRPGRKERDLSLHALEQVGMVDFASRQISQLSGGQQQRTFLARALVQDAQIYFMDEPFAAVDAVTERAIVNILRELKNRGKTVLVVHHDLQTVEDYFDWVTLLNVEVIASGATATTFTPENLQKTYGGRVSYLHGGQVIAASGD